jgi:membrane protease subunit HflK
MNVLTPLPEPLGLRLKSVAGAARQLAAGIGRRLSGADRVLSNGRNEGPPDLDELWRDFNRKLSGLFGGKGGGGGGGGFRRGGGDGGDGGGPFQPNMKSAGIGAGLIAGVAALVWLGSGFFIVQEGQQAVVTSFGKYSHTR